MATQIESRDSRQTALSSFPLRLPHPVNEAAILLAPGDRTIWRLACEGRPEAVLLSCRLSVAWTALEKLIAEDTEAIGYRFHIDPPHMATGLAASAQSVQS
jgi:hypothetical protein